MSSSNVPPDRSIKYESTYDLNSSNSPPSPGLKRRRSERSHSSGEKRQRVGSFLEPGQSEELATYPIQTASKSRSQFMPDSTSVQSNQTTVQSPRNSSRTPDTGSSSHTNSFMTDPYLYMRILSLPMLESLSTQVLSTLSQGPYHETIRIVTSPDSELGQAYSTLKYLFDQTKKIYSQQAAFLSADDLNIMEPEHRATIRTTNLATFVSSVFCGHDVGFIELNDHFIQTFTLDGAPLEKEPGELYLNLKTQMYLSAVSQEEQERTREDILEDFFPNGIEEILEDRHLDIPLTETEIDFVKAFSARRDYLADAPIDVDSIQSLSEKFAWEDFLRQLVNYLSKEPLIAPYMKRHALTAPHSPPRASRYNQDYMLPSIEDDIRAQAERAAKETLESLGFGNAQRPHDYQSSPSTTFQPDYSGIVLPKEQTAPTQVLYERARQAAVAKSNPGNTRRPGLPSQRRPWSGEEERALMAGLDQVKGPHWSQILALYGPRGTINEVLKDRNQVQLKDKARNLKLFFLKSGIEVPYYLKTVTGELKTRAPTQAAKREAEERARLASADEQARMNGVMALASGLQDRNQENDEDDTSPMLSREGSDNAEDGPEKLHVVPPKDQDHNSPSPPLTADESLRQSLIAATSAAPNT